MIQRFTAVGVLCVAGGVCVAQSATVAVTHDHPSGLVEPGQTVRISVLATWQGAAQLGRVAGDALATPDIGIAGPGSVNSAGPLINLGTPVGGSVRGVDIASGPPAGFGLHLLFGFQPVAFLMYDWTAPSTPGEVRFDWRPSVALPQVQMYLTASSVTLASVPTTYLGTSITVIPAPASAAVLGDAMVVLGGRRRRGGY